jgi:ATP-dependent helicase/nuclease subunit A
VTYTPCKAVHEDLKGQAVQVHGFVGNTKADEAQRVVELVKQAQSENAKGTIAILVRSKNHLTQIVPGLNAAGLRFRAVEIEKLRDRPMVQDLLALTRALSHPADRLSWLAVLRAPWCGLTLSDLHALAGDDRGSPMWSLMTDNMRCQQLSTDGQRRLARVRAVLAESRLQRRRRRLHRQIEGAWLALGGPATALRQADLDDARTYFNLLEQWDDGGGLADFGAFEADVEALHAAPDPHADASVQIMTIHKAKGLEFDTVIVPGLGYAPRAESRGLLTWLERVNRDGATDLLIAPIAASTDSGPEATYRAIRKLITVKTQHEDGRLLYVAATRARRRLHLLGHVKQTKDTMRKAASRSLLACLWPAVAEHFVAAATEPFKAATRGEPKPAITPRIRRFSSAWRLPSPPPGINLAAIAEPITVDEAVDHRIEFHWAGETARLVGAVTHRLLQRLAREGVACWNGARLKSLRDANIAALAAAGVPYNKRDEALARVQQALLNTLEDERGRWLFDTRHLQARAEYALSGIVNGQLVNIKIDRTFVDQDGMRWIIDYKTGTHEGAAIETFLKQEQERYRPQLTRYAALMRLIESRPIRVGLYYPLIQGGWREWPAD